MEDFMLLKNQLCFAVYETASEFNKLYTGALQPYGLTYPQYLVLLALWEKAGDNFSYKKQHFASKVEEEGTIMSPLPKNLLF